MNFFKRAVVSVTRRKPKSFILLLIVLILGNIMLSSMLIVQSVDGTRETILKRLPPIVSLDFDFEAFQQETEPGAAGGESPWLTFDDLDRIAAAARPYIKSYDFSFRTGMITDSLQRVEVEGAFTMPGFRPAMNFIGTSIPMFTLLETGDAEISAGRTFTEQELAEGSAVLLISEDLAELNNITLGEIVTIDSDIVDFTAMGEQNVFRTLTYDFRVIGFLRHKEVPAAEGQGQNNPELLMQRERVNNLIAPNNFIRVYNEAWMEVQRELSRERGLGMEWGAMDPNALVGVTSISYVLNSSEDFEPFVSRASTVLGNPFYNFTSQEDNFKEISGPLESMREILSYALYITLLSSVVVLGLVLFAFIRDRQKEIGIYFALGEKKLKIVLQLIVETVTVGLIGAVLSVAGGSYVASIITRIMLPAQIAPPEGMMAMPVFVDDYLADIDYGSILQQFQIALSVDSILTFLAAILITIILAQLFASIYILRFDPKKILM